MIRKLNVEHIDKVINAANNNTLNSVSIYKANKGKNFGSHMVDYSVDTNAIPNAVIQNEIHAEFIRSIRQVRQHIVNNDYALIDLSYDVSSRALKFRIVGK